VRHGRRGDDIDRLEHRVADILKQALARAEQHRSGVQVQLAKQRGRDELLYDVRSTRHRNIAVAR